MKRIFTLATLCVVVSSSSALAFQATAPFDLSQDNLFETKESLQTAIDQTEKILGQLPAQSVQVNPQEVPPLIVLQSKDPEAGDLGKASGLETAPKHDPYLTLRPTPKAQRNIQHVESRMLTEGLADPVEVVLRAQAAEKSTDLGAASEKPRTVVVDSEKPVVVVDTVPAVPFDQSNPFVTPTETGSVSGVADVAVRHQRAETVRSVDSVDSVDSAEVTSPAIVGRVTETETTIPQRVVTLEPEAPGTETPVVTEAVAPVAAAAGTTAQATDVIQRSVRSNVAADQRTTGASERAAAVVTEKTVRSNVAANRRTRQREVAGVARDSSVGAAVAERGAVTSSVAAEPQTRRRSKAGLPWWSVLALALLPILALAGIYWRGAATVGRTGTRQREEKLSSATSTENSRGASVEAGDQRSVETSEFTTSRDETRADKLREAEARGVESCEVDSRGTEDREVEACGVETREVESRGSETVRSAVREVRARGTEDREVEACDVETREAESRGSETVRSAVREVRARGTEHREVEACDVETREVESCDSETERSEGREVCARGTESRTPETVAAGTDRPGSRDEFTVIQGIDAETQQALYDAGFLRFSDLAEASRKQLGQVFSGRRRKFKSSELARWSRQAALADRGELKSAARPVESPKSRKKKSSSRSRSGSPRSVSRRSRSKADDLTKIHGVGPVTQRVLRSCGIDCFEQIAEMTSEELSGLFADQKNRFRSQDTSTWPEQARSFVEQRESDESHDIALLEEINEIRAMASGSATDSGSRKRAESKVK